MTRILHKYWSCTLKRLRRTWLFPFSCLMCLTVCSPPWSCLQSWSSSRLPPYLIWKGVVGTGKEERRDWILPLHRQDQWLQVELSLWRKDIAGVGWSSPPCFSSRSCEICSQVATPKWFFLRWEWCPVAACHALGTLLHCQGAHSSAIFAVTMRTWCLVSPNCCATMVAEDLCQKAFLASPILWAVTPQVAELPMSSATTWRLIRSLQGILQRVSASFVIFTLGLTATEGTGAFPVAFNGLFALGHR